MATFEFNRDEIELLFVAISDSVDQYDDLIKHWEQKPGHDGMIREMKRSRTLCMGLRDQLEEGMEDDD